MIYNNIQQGGCFMVVNNIKAQILKRLGEGTLPMRVIDGGSGKDTFYGSIEGRPLAVTLSRQEAGDDMNIEVFSCRDLQDSRTSVLCSGDDVKTRLPEELHRLAGDICSD